MLDRVLLVAAYMTLLVVTFVTVAAVNYSVSKIDKSLCSVLYAAIQADIELLVANDPGAEDGQVRRTVARLERTYVGACGDQ